MFKHIKLPHIDLIGYCQFITFRTNDSLDSYLQKIYNSTLPNPKKQFILDNHLDNSNKGAYLYDNKIDIFKKVIFEKNGNLYQLISYAIMPNHIHILLEQKSSLTKIMKYIKGKSAIELNKALGKKGKFWASDYYDRVIRNVNHLNVVYEYILDNPTKANLDDRDERVFTDTKTLNLFRS